RPFANRVDWFYEVGFDSHSLSADPGFVNPAGADGVMGYSSAPVGVAQVIDNSSAAGFTTTGTWTRHTDGGIAGDYLTAPAGNGTTTATWTFTSLTPGATYQIAVTWPTGYHNWTSDAPYSVLDGTHVIDKTRLSQYYTGNTTWFTLGSFKPTG